MPGFVLPEEFDTSKVRTPVLQPSGLEPLYAGAMMKALQGFQADSGQTVPDIGAILAEPVADPNVMGFGGADSTAALKDAYAGRIANVTALANALKERTAAMRAPGQIVQDIADAAHKTGQLSTERLKAETEAFKLRPEYAQIVGAQELYKKMGETHGQLEANRRYTESLDAMPLPPEVKELTGLQTYNQIRLLTGSDSAQAISGFVNAVARIKAAGIGAGGNVAAANKIALGSLVTTLNTERQTVQNQMAGHLATQKALIAPTPKNKVQWDEAAYGVQRAQSRLQAIDQALNNLSTHLGTQVGVPVVGGGGAPTPANPPAGVPGGRPRGAKPAATEKTTSPPATITQGGVTYTYKGGTGPKGYPIYVDPSGKPFEVKFNTKGK